MSFLVKHFDPWHLKLLGFSISSGAVFILILKWSGFFKTRKVKVEYPRDTVIVHDFQRGPFAPSMVPFAIKVETYLRILKIPYIYVPGIGRSPKDKFPWIEYNGEIVGDSAFCIKFINKTFGKDLDSNFNEYDLGAAHAFRKMMEENSYWTFVLCRWVYDDKKTMYKYSKIPLTMVGTFRKYIKDCTHRHGIGRHNEQEVCEIMREDLEALSRFLGTKKYILGDSPCQADCAIFGQLCQFYWHSVGSRAESTVKEFKNLCDYCFRMKEEFWPDWDSFNIKSVVKK